MPACHRNVACHFAGTMPKPRVVRAPAARRRRVAITMVEVLVLIVVIGVLMGLLFPAIGSRENSRFTRCLNNQGELAKAVLQYENTKKQLPGYIEGMGRFPVSWVTVMLPYTGHKSLYNDWEAWFRQQHLQEPESKYALAVDIEQFKCPEDRRNRVPYPLSYVVNCGMPDDLTSHGPPDWPANGAFFSHDPRLPRERVVITTSTGIRDGAEYTLMLSENIQAGRWTDPYREVRPPRSPTDGMPEYGYCFQSNPPPNWKPPLVEPLIGMVWFADPNSPNVPGRKINDRARDVGHDVADFNYARPSSFHVGAVAATFCDGHSRRLRESIDYRVYAQLMSSCDREVKLPGSDVAPTLPADWHKPITESDTEI